MIYERSPEIIAKMRCIHPDEAVGMELKMLKYPRSLCVLKTFDGF